MYSYVCNKTAKNEVWKRVFYHDISSGIFNKSTDNCMASYEENKFSILSELSSSFRLNGAFEFILEYPEVGFIRWKQNILPTKVGQPSHKKMRLEIISNEKNFSYFEGLALSDWTGRALLDGETTIGYWYCICLMNKESKIPGPITVLNGTQKEIRVNKVSLWIRIPPLITHSCKRSPISFALSLTIFILLRW